ncbi:MAG: NADP-specific glutamate dehydrogenase [Erysipelotrichaceae bacterium]|nr:NADP-specific glutamate dehydrogenase [Erysipelotrichaceae bacterium]
MTSSYIEKVLEQVKKNNSEQPEFIQAVTEVLTSLQAVIEAHPEYENQAILERLIEPERIVMFKVPVEMDDHHVEVYRGYRIQHNGALGPYKGGIRFNPNVNLSVMKFLAFEQTFKNALTALPMGGAKGGSNFDPKGKSEGEVRRFCESFMTELYRHIGPEKDVPAGDMGVGGREIGYMYGTYRRLIAESKAGAITGKGIGYGGSLARKEATGFGLVYFVKEVLKNHPINNPRAVISGSGNVAIYACQKARELGWKVIGMSDSRGYILDEDLDLETVKQIKEVQRASLEKYPEMTGHGSYHAGSIYDADFKADIVLPCACQNEIDLKRAKHIKECGVQIVAEGANMPDDNEAIAFYKANGIIFVPGKASNAGGVATSGLEMSQNSQHLSWTFDEVDNKLHNIMISIHDQCRKACKKYGLPEDDYVSGANIAGFTRVVEAMIAQGIY